MLPLVKPIKALPKPYVQKLDMNKMGEKLPSKNAPTVHAYKKTV